MAHFAELTPPIAAPSLALVNKVIQHLREQAFVEPLPNRGFALRDAEGLLREWSAAYRFDRNVRQRYFTLLHGRTLQEKLRALDPNALGRVAFAAFSAADFQAANVRQPRTWLYVSPRAKNDFETAIEAKLVDSGENVVVMVPDDLAVFYRLEANKSRLACTNAVQTYVDLIHAGGRGAEAAEALLEQRLRPAWGAAAR
ncbi:MAG: type IV toxin-antitoxin system AbiEi family antitoxin [Vicinamibacterales bacterium]